MGVVIQIDSAHIVQAMHEAIDDPATHNYPPYQGTNFREAAVKWMERGLSEGLNPILR